MINEIVKSEDNADMKLNMIQGVLDMASNENWCWILQIICLNDKI